MRNRYLPFLLIVPGLLAGSVAWMAAQEEPSDNTVIRKVVNMVQLNVAVTDDKGNYITGLRPSDFSIVEDKIPQQLATFEEGGDESLRSIEVAAETPSPGDNPATPPRPVPGIRTSTQSSGASIFVLFDTSNYMYKDRGFVFAQDAIAEFIRSLAGQNKIAFYSYSRDLYRQTALTTDRSQILHGVRATVNGADSALYNALLLTLRDAGQITGRKAIVVFSNGPDNSSMVPPEDVGELAQSEGVPIYMVSTHDAKLDAVSAAVFARISATTGGEVYFAKSWKDQRQAFTAIRDDLAHLYVLSYYPQPNPNRGWRAINVKLVGNHLKKYKIRTRNGYRPLPERTLLGTGPTAPPPQ